MNSHLYFKAPELFLVKRSLLLTILKELQS